MEVSRYIPLNEKAFVRSPYWQRLNVDQQKNFMVTTQVLPFRCNQYVLDELIDWQNIPDDPIYQLVFPQQGMLTQEHFLQLENALAVEDKGELKKCVNTIRLSMNPHPAGQLEANQPCLKDDTPVQGIQHKYRETLLFFPAAAQMCHAYCSFCFRWPQFVDMPGYKFQAKESQKLVMYLRENPHVSDVLLTGGDPMVMNIRSFFSGSTLCRPVRKFACQHIPLLLNSIYKERVTHFCLVPTMMDLLLRYGTHLKEAFNTRDFKHFLCMAAMLPKSLWEEFESVTGKEVVNSFGLPLSLRFSPVIICCWKEKIACE